MTAACRFTAYIPRTAAHLMFGALTVFGIDGILLKFDHVSSRLLPVTLATLLALSLLHAALARRIPASQRNALDRMWAALDRYSVVWLTFFLMLLMLFHLAFTRAGGDGRSYFAQLHAMFIAHSLDMDRESRMFGAQDPGIFPFGSAILWLPFYALAHLWLLVLNVFGGGLRRDGYFYPYQMAAGLGSLVYGFTGLVLIYKVACDYFTRWVSLAATLVVCVGSFLLWYLVVESSYSHGNSLFAVTLFLFIWHRTRAHRSPVAWGWLGIVAALMVMVRWQNAVFLAPAVVDVLRICWRNARGSEAPSMRAFVGPVLAAIGFAIGFLPQMYFWKVVNGHWLGVPHGEAGQQWWRDSLILDVLFSPNHGLLAWQPVLYLAVLGAPLFLMRDRYLGSLLTLVFAAQVYINGAVATWWGGSAFGGRRFDGCLLFFVLGLATLITWCRKRPVPLLGGIFAILLMVNTFFMLDVFSGRLPLGDGISSSQILDATIRRLGNPFALPASAILAWRSGADLAAYDRVGLRLYNSPQIDVGDPTDEGFLAGGWSGREQERGTTYRWAEGRESSFIIGLRGPTFLRPDEPQRLADYVLRIGAAPFTFRGSPPQALNLEVNGRLLDGRRMAPEFSEYSFDIPNRLLHRSLNIFTLRYDYARSPQSLGMSDDPRQLSVRVDYIKLFPK